MIGNPDAVHLIRGYEQAQSVSVFGRSLLLPLSISRTLHYFLGNGPESLKLERNY
jgi:hypothetical protein